MAKKRPRRQKAKRGPYIAAAAFCESVIEGKDGCLTPVRIIDSITVAIDASNPPEFPSNENRLSVDIWSLVILKSGDSPGEHLVRLVVESPSGSKKTGYEQVVTLSEPAQGGINLRIHQTIGVVEGGLFWVHVLVDGKRLTSMPLLIRVTREQPPVASPTPNGQPALLTPKRSRRKS